ncbi:MAG: permease-like cell division protein FtsX [Acidimicrobiia bacterium]|jgi:cell division transport system permease protein
MRIQYVLVEALNNIRRNGLVVLGAVVAVFISLFLTFGTLVFGEIARVNTLQWSEDVRVIAFLSDDFHDAPELLATVQGWPEVDEAFYMSKPEAAEEAKELLTGAARRQYEENPSLAPASIRVRPVDLNDYETIERNLQNAPGVFKVASAADAVQQIAAIRDGLNVFFWVLALALGAAAVALIANTIHMAIYARREELEIMRLVGASNWFIRTPFLIEGVLEGVVGAGLSVAAVTGLYNLARDRLQALPEFINLAIDSAFVVRWGVLILVFGAVVGFLGSSLSLAMHRYVRS